MKNFKSFLAELKNPAEISQFKKDVSGLNAVDARSQDWAKTLRSLMAKHGFEMLGRGKYAQVYGHPSYNYALKIFMKDAAFMKWLAFVQKNQDNPFVPKLRGKVLKLSPYVFAIRMEKLGFGSPSQAGNFMGEYQKWRSNNSYVSPNPHIQAILVEFSNNKKLLDIHGENLMLRSSDKTEVVVDPYYNWYGKHAPGYTIDPDEIDTSLF